VHLESNAWAVISGAITKAQGESAMDAVMEYLYTPFGLMLNAPSFVTPDDSVGFVTRVYPGVKENGAIFSHPNPWAGWRKPCWAGARRRDEAVRGAFARCARTILIEVRQSEPYAYCQFIMGAEHNRPRPGAPPVDDRQRGLGLLRRQPATCWASARSGTA
jgi:N,N'-diacetylchitobiose phosphorylase